MVRKMDIPKPPSSKGGAVATKQKAAPAAPPAPVKKFSVVDWDGGTSGEKIIIYGDSGMGKTTCASMAPDAVFIGLDDGGRKIVHPITGAHLRAIPGVESFTDVRSALQQTDLIPEGGTVVVDTVTLLEEWTIPFVLETIPNDKGAKMNNIIKYGYGKGFRHLYDTMKLVLGDCDKLIRQGKNVIFIAQSAPNKVANASGEDYLREGPRLTSQNGANIEALYCEWADHIFRIGYQFINVEERKASSTQDRAIFVHGKAHFRAKSRTIDPKYPVISFDNPADDSIWKFLFPESE